MSERSGSALLDKDQIAKSFGRSLIGVIDNFIKEEDRLNVIYTTISIFFDSMNDDGRSLVLKKVLMHFLRKFPTDFENADQADDYIRKTLNLWRMFGKCSKTMGPVAILERIEDSYADCWQYYQLLAESLIEEERTTTDELYKTFKKCMENCELSNEEVRKRFGLKIMSFIKFPNNIEEEECTVNFMQGVYQSGVRKSLAVRRQSNVMPGHFDIVLEKESDNPSKIEIERLSIQENTAKSNVLQSLEPALKTPNIQQPVRDIKSLSPASITDYQDITIQATNQSPKKDDFTVFRDPTLVLKTTRAINPMASPATQSPIAKRGKNEINDKENQSFDQNSPTVCGTHLQPKNNNLSFLTSTPEMNKKSVPKFASEISDFHKPQASIDFGTESPDPIQQLFVGQNRRRTIGLFDKDPDWRRTSRPVTSNQQKEPHPRSSLDKLNSLTRNFNQINLLNSPSIQDVTGDGSISLIFDGILNPWNEKDRNIILSTSKFVPQRNCFLTQNCPKIDKTQPFVLDSKKFHPLKQIGQGGFARVFKCKYDDKIVALKYQKPACAFEIHVVDLLQSVLPKNLKPFVMSLTDAFIYNDASALVYEYLPYKTLLELSNAYRLQGTDIYGGVVSLIGLQLGTILQRIHEARIIHADLKPDNILLLCPKMSESLEVEKLIDFPLIRLIDFGRAIDMNYFNGKEFTGKVKTQCFDCVEMKNGQPWTYQTDYYGFVATIYTLIQHQYMEIKMDSNRVRTKLPIKRRMATSGVWTDIFDKFLNIPSCKQIPSWDPILKSLRKEILQLAESDVPSWKNALRTLNKMVQSNCEKT